jgi:hypothetical protein
MKAAATLMTVKEAAAYLTALRNRPVSVSAVWRLVYAKKNALPQMRMGRSVYIVNLPDWIARQTSVNGDAQPAAEHGKAVKVRRRPVVSAREPRANSATVYRFGVPERVAAAGGR